MQKEPTFVPKPGQVDYTNIRYAPVVNSVVTQNGKVLLVQRNPNMRLYPGHWNGISGFLDDAGSIEDKITEELREEAGIGAERIVAIERGQPLLQEAPEYKKTWLVVPLLVRITGDEVTLNWEAQQARWFAPDELVGLQLLPGYQEVLDQLLPRV